MMIVVGAGIGEGRFPIIGKTPAEDVLKELVAFSEKKENWFDDPAKSAERRANTNPVPEGDGHHKPHSRSLKLQGAGDVEEEYHLSFTITVAQLMSREAPLEAKGEVLVRHATIGVGDMSRYVDMTEAFTILKFLGFKDPSHMIITPHPTIPALVFMEQLTPEEENTLRMVNSETGKNAIQVMSKSIAKAVDEDILKDVVDGKIK